MLHKHWSHANCDRSCCFIMLGMKGWPRVNSCEDRCVCILCRITWTYRNQPETYCYGMKLLASFAINLWAKTKIFNDGVELFIQTLRKLLENDVLGIDKLMFCIQTLHVKFRHEDNVKVCCFCFSGGDDCKLKCWDLRDTSRPTFCSNR